MKKIKILISIITLSCLVLPFIPTQAVEDYCIWSPIMNDHPKPGEDVCNMSGEQQYFVQDNTASGCAGKQKQSIDKICCCQIKERPGQCWMSQTCPAGQNCVDGWCKGPDTSSSASAPIFTPPNPQIKIPGLNLIAEDVKCDVDDYGGYQCKVPWIGQYIITIYNYGLSIAGIIAAIVLMAGGILWLISGGDASKVTRAKELIMGSITGLIILVTSYVLLIQVNPDLVKFRSITVGHIETVVLIENGSDSKENINATTCSNDSDLINIKSIVATFNVSDPRLTKNTTEGLKKAVTEATRQGAELLVTSANRNYDEQKRLYDKALKANNGDETVTQGLVASPSNCIGTCYSHCAGVAIDVCIKGSVSCGKMKKDYVKYSDPDVVKLQDIMKKAGWKRYCGEWWHFQYGSDPKQACSP